MARDDWSAYEVPDTSCGFAHSSATRIMASVLPDSGSSETHSPRNVVTRAGVAQVAAAMRVMATPWGRVMDRYVSRWSSTSSRMVRLTSGVSVIFFSVLPGLRSVVQVVGGIVGEGRV